MDVPEPKTREWFLLNAVCMWLQHYPDHEWTQQYKDLRDELINPPKKQGRGRPAKRQKQAKASKDTAS